MTTLNDFKYSLLSDEDKQEIDKHNKTTGIQHQQSTSQQHTLQQHTSQQHTPQTESHQDKSIYDYCGLSNLLSKLTNCLGIDNAFTFF